MPTSFNLDFLQFLLGSAWFCLKGVAAALICFPVAWVLTCWCWPHMNTLALQIRCLRAFMRLVYKGQHALEAIRRRTLKRLHHVEMMEKLPWTRSKPAVRARKEQAV